MPELFVSADLRTNEMWLSQFGPTDKFFNTTYGIISSDRCIVKQATSRVENKLYKMQKKKSFSIKRDGEWIDAICQCQTNEQQSSCIW